MDEAELLQLADGLRPATQAEWDQLVADVERRGGQVVDTAPPPPTVTTTQAAAQDG